MWDVLELELLGWHHIVSFGGRGTRGSPSSDKSHAASSTDDLYNDADCGPLYFSVCLFYFFFNLN